MENMTLLELGQERDRLINESLKLQEHIRKLKKQARELEIEIAWARHGGQRMEPSFVILEGNR